MTIIMSLYFSSASLNCGSRSSFLNRTISSSNPRCRPRATWWFLFRDSIFSSRCFCSLWNHNWHVSLFAMSVSQFINQGSSSELMRVAHFIVSIKPVTVKIIVLMSLKWRHYWNKSIFNFGKDILKSLLWVGEASYEVRMPKRCTWKRINNSFQRWK